MVSEYRCNECVCVSSVEKAWNVFDEALNEVAPALLLQPVTEYNPVPNR